MYEVEEKEVNVSPKFKAYVDAYLVYLSDYFIPKINVYKYSEK